MKYIRFENPSESSPNFILFVAPMLHAEVAAMAASVNLKPVSAGFYDPASGQCFGRSSTLNLAPGQTDSSILSALARATLASSPDKPKPAMSPTERAEIERFGRGEPRDHLTGNFTAR